MAVAPNFDFPFEKSMTSALASWITEWTLHNPEKSNKLAALPTEFPALGFFQNLSKGANYF